mgnify:CR=1 FL=1
MSDMRLIMEGWRQYSIDEQQCDEMVNFINEYYGESVLTESVMADLKKKLGPATLGLLLAAASVLGMPAEALAQDADIQLPAAAQQMDQEQAKKIMDTKAGEFVKGLLDKTKDVKVKDLLKKKGATDAPEEAPAPAEEAKGELLGTGTSVSAQVAKEMAYDRAADNGYVGGDKIIGELTMNPDPDFGHNYGTYTYTIYRALTPEAN